MLKRLAQVCFFFILGIASSIGQEPINWKKPNKWVDSVYNVLTLDERIAQLIMIPVFPMRDSAHIKEVECAVREQKVGGIIVFKSTPYRHATQVNYFQSLAKTPLLVGIDGEWGVGMRVDSVLVFPRQMVLGAGRNEEVAYKMGVAVANQCKRLGIHINFAPDVDVNNNPKNPVINDRSFGENRNWVAKLGWQYAKGMQDQGIMASAKHFPGHGDTETDSHYGLPVVKGDRKRLDSLELFPFKKLIDNGVMSVMTAHLNVPALDTTSNIASSLSRKIVTGVLREEMGFDGIIVTDALNMKGVTEFYKPGEVTAKALAAGNDLMEFVEDVGASIEMIKAYMVKGEITEAQLEASCKRILLAKYWAGLPNYQPINLAHLTEDLNCCNNFIAVKNAIREGIVVAKNDDRIIPLANPELYQKAIVAVGTAQLSAFQKFSMNYVKADYFSIDKAEIPASFDTLYSVLKNYNLIVLSMQNTSRFVSKKLGLTPLQIDFVNKVLALDKKVILVNHGNPYILREFTNLRNVIQAYEDLDMYNQLSAEVLFGATTAHGVMPVTVDERFQQGVGTQTETLQRLNYIYPDELQIPELALSGIDSVVQEAIRNGATPGAQVVVAKNGHVVYQKSFGYHAYDSVIPVENHHLYDLASLTKILATTVAVMHLYDQHKIKLDAHLGDYLPELKGTNKEKLMIWDVLLHQAGLVAFIPTYKSTLIDGKPNQLLYADTADAAHSIQVARNLWLDQSYMPMLWQQLVQSEVKPAGSYVYSDLGMIFMRRVVEQQSGMSFEAYLRKYIYDPLNLNALGFNPNGRLNPDWIVPTANDTVFRGQLLKGFVHDPTAALMGGVSGHAGLFGSANDVAIIMQMLLNGGTYGGKRILKESSVNLFTRKQLKSNRRGLGFDKPETDPKKASPTAKAASPMVFGHTGFTGTCAWADPKHGLVYVFLSNRVHPSDENKKLTDTNVRTRIQEIIYEAIKEK